MEKLWGLLTDELDSQPSPPTPDPPDVGQKSNTSQMGTPENTQPTPPPQQMLFKIPIHLQDIFVNSQDEGEDNHESSADQNKTSKAKKRTLSEPPNPTPETKKLTQAEKQKAYRARKVAEASQHGLTAPTKRDQSLPSTIKMTPAQKQAAYRARKAAQSKSQDQGQAESQSSNTDSEQLPDLDYVPLFPNHSTPPTPNTARKKPMTNAEKNELKGIERHRNRPSSDLQKFDKPELLKQKNKPSSDVAKTVTSMRQPEHLKLKNKPSSALQKFNKPELLKRKNKPSSDVTKTVSSMRQPELMKQKNKPSSNVTKIVNSI